ncbi:MAG: rane protein containing diguanylate cyclase domain [Anaerocolumna sp.]|nr:rane protein containing diguanylate cyclase domain [Anaerocolumna sp.]
MKDKKMPKTIPGIIKIINESNDMDTIERMENYIGCYYGIPVLIVGSVVNFILHYPLKSAIADSAFMLFLCFCFILSQYVKVKTRIITHWISILFSVVLIFVVVRAYAYVGPAIWTIAFINIIISSVRLTRVMLNYVTASIFLIGMYYSLLLSDTPFEFGTSYFILQLILFALVVVIAPVAHLINQAHYSRINGMYMTELKQREELEKMYERIAITHTELSCKYNELNEKNLELQDNEDKLFHLAHFDMVTELPNRMAIIEKIQELIKRSKSEEVSFYIAFIDIDSFKKINDTMGHHIGDLFLEKAAERFKASLHKDDMIGRIGGDEFALIISRDVNWEDAYYYIDNIRQEFLKPFFVCNNEIRTSASFGIAAYPEDGIGVIELMRNADTAMYKAKEYGKNNIQFFEGVMKKEIIDKVNFETELKTALQNEEFFLVYQPIYNLKEKTIRGFEVLTRWNSPNLGFVSPDRFIRVAEELGLIIPLGEWIIRTACKTFRDLQEKHKLEGLLSINLSVKQLEDPNIIDVIDNALKEADLEAKYLEIEITESILISSVESIMATLEILRCRDIHISLDDFGTGYSSLSYLRKLPIDILKIDKSFIDDLLIENKNLEIIGSIINLAHNLDISVVAEGIEEENQIHLLEKLKCDYIQGYYIGRPMKIEDLDDYINKFNG